MFKIKNITSLSFCVCVICATTVQLLIIVTIVLFFGYSQTLSIYCSLLYFSLSTLSSFFFVSFKENKSITNSHNWGEWLQLY